MNFYFQIHYYFLNYILSLCLSFSNNKFSNLSLYKFNFSLKIVFSYKFKLDIYTNNINIYFNGTDFRHDRLILILESLNAYKMML